MADVVRLQDSGLIFSNNLSYTFGKDIGQKMDWNWEGLCKKAKRVVFYVLGRGVEYDAASQNILREGKCEALATLTGYRTDYWSELGEVVQMDVFGRIAMALHPKTFF